MPYKLRKAPRRDLYWVIAQDGKHMSKDPIPKERAEAQMRALYANVRDVKGKGNAPVSPSPPIDPVVRKLYHSEPNPFTKFVNPYTEEPTDALIYQVYERPKGSGIFRYIKPTGKDSEGYDTGVEVKLTGPPPPKVPISAPPVSPPPIPPPPRAPTRPVVGVMDNEDAQGRYDRLIGPRARERVDAYRKRIYLDAYAEYLKKLAEYNATYHTNIEATGRGKLRKKGGATITERGLASFLREKYYFGSKGSPLENVYAFLSSVVHSPNSRPTPQHPYSDLIRGGEGNVSLALEELIKSLGQAVIVNRKWLGHQQGNSVIPEVPSWTRRAPEAVVPSRSRVQREAVAWAPLDPGGGGGGESAEAEPEDQEEYERLAEEAERAEAKALAEAEASAPAPAPAPPAPAPKSKPKPKPVEESDEVVLAREGKRTEAVYELLRQTERKFYEMFIVPRTKRFKEIKEMRDAYVTLDGAYERLFTEAHDKVNKLATMVDKLDESSAQLEEDFKSGKVTKEAYDKKKAFLDTMYHKQTVDKSEIEAINEKMREIQRTVSGRKKNEEELVAEDEEYENNMYAWLRANVDARDLHALFGEHNEDYEKWKKAKYGEGPLNVLGVVHVRAKGKGRYRGKGWLDALNPYNIYNKIVGGPAPAPAPAPTPKPAGSRPPNSILHKIAVESYNAPPARNVGDFSLFYATPTLKFYRSGNTVVVGIRGTVPTDLEDVKADALVGANKLESSSRFKKDEAEMNRWHRELPSAEWYGVGHSLGGAVLDGLLRKNLLISGVSYNPAVQPKDFNGNLPNHRIYQQGDPLYALGKNFLSKENAPEVRPAKAKTWKDTLMGFIPGSSALGYLDSHNLSNFEGGGKSAERPTPPNPLSREEYLSRVRAKAKSAGYPYKLLGFSDDGVHKFQIPNAEGKIIRFGRDGYGDFIIWSALEASGKTKKGMADQKRRVFHKSHTKIKGDWRSDLFSPNNLALKILW